MENDKTKEEIKEDLSDETESDKLPYEGNMSETIKDDENNLVSAETAHPENMQLNIKIHIVRTIYFFMLILPF